MGRRLSIEELQEALDEDSSWRKREISAIKFLIIKARRHEESALRRAGITLAYAHWEGYVKSSVETVLKYVAQQGLRECELNYGLLARSMRSEIQQISSSRMHEPIVNIIRRLRSDMQENCSLDVRANTRSNLKTDIFRDLMESIGVDPDSIMLQGGALTEFGLDRRLVDRRNDIAHGKFNDPGMEECLEVLEAVIALVDAVNTTLANYVLMRTYMADVSEPLQS